MLGVAEPTHPAHGQSPLPTREEIAAAFPAFEVGEMIGHGGMGAVFRVRQRKLERDVALKVLPRHLAADPAFAERFHREARALARLNHPNIVTIHDFGQQGGWYYLLMELVDGVNLGQAMHTSRFTPEQALELIPQVCGALQYAHSEGVLHRDIKPGNLLLDAKGRVKIADFGIAKLGLADGADIRLTLSGARLGTVAYMAPEQIERPDKVDHRADIYSLGVVFYEMLTGELPIGRFPAPSEKSPVGAQVDQVVFRTLEKERERRYQSAGEMRTEVETLATQGAQAAVVPPPIPSPPAGAGSPTPGPGPAKPPELELPRPIQLTPAAGSSSPSRNPGNPNPMELRHPVPPEAAPPARRFAGPGMALGMLLFGVFVILSMVITVRTQTEPVIVNGSEYHSQPADTGTPMVAMMLPGLLLVGAILISNVLAWKNVIRLRPSAPPRRGLVVASICALLPWFIPVWMVIGSEIRDEYLAWLDALVVTGVVLTWFCCWVNPRPLPWSGKAVFGFTCVFIAVLFLAHSWHALELLAQSRRLPAGFLVRLSSRDRVLVTLAAGFAVSATLLGWMARTELLRNPGERRGLGLANVAAWFWPVAILPLYLVFQL